MWAHRDVECYMPKNAINVEVAATAAVNVCHRRCIQGRGQYSFMRKLGGAHSVETHASHHHIYLYLSVSLPPPRLISANPSRGRGLCGTVQFGTLMVRASCVRECSMAVVTAVMWPSVEIQLSRLSVGRRRRSVGRSHSNRNTSKLCDRCVQ